MKDHWFSDAFESHSGTISGQIELLKQQNDGSRRKENKREIRAGPPGAEDMAHLIEEPELYEPTKKLIGTIRHDQDSEIAIQSKESLKADRESLERMVVDFAIEHPENGTNYSDAQIAEIRLKVKEGDLTPVLKAYEREMQSPIKNAVMGDLVRTLLIQVQKTN